ncbi:crosslink repair DNA glycosylase YcaQ family protein [Blastococcus sp. BMG 814]|uniref:Crosslink repair DNA glycosylase YcaQ family protein n=1 Tax=Blastococcus carthaginiensis TaxID=3050034 RepID=A0ABT9ICQ2_9ACTN|nr:crosslink repair DNA glycosylase YcaQ family protein [Blastococcus carthaginiensis]MDP5183346.1 crosslink repair DNA glycosylase YcaQ family protein [Blastococcus carthaginiensis]
MSAHRLDRDEARAIAVRAQWLGRHRPENLLATVRHLMLLQVDPTAAVAPSADLVAWSRLGSSYHPEQLTRALEDRSLVEHNALVRPMEDIALLLAGMARWPSREAPREWLRANESFRRDVVERLRSSGPLLSREIPDTSSVPWASTGWTDDRNVTQMLEFLMMRGEVAIAGRRGRQRLWDVADRVYPPGMPVVPEDEARRIRAERRLRALGIAREKGASVPGEPVDVGDTGEPAVVEGVPGTWRVDPNALGRPFLGRTALLSPFDRLVHDRVRTQEIFGFEYVLEMYKPKARRRWGYFALPVLHHDKLVGKLDAVADRSAGRFVVNELHEDVPLTASARDEVRAEIEALAGWLGLAVTDRAS